MDAFNPYAAPATIEPAPDAAGAHGAPSEPLRKVASGIALIRNALLLVAFAAILFVVGPLIDVGLFLIGLHGGGRAANDAIHSVVGLSVVVAATMNLLGNLRCLATPPEARARGLIVTVVVAELCGMILLFGLENGALVRDAQHARRAALALLVEIVLGFTALVAFTLFLRRLAWFLARPDLAQRAAAVLVLTGVIAGIYVVENVFAAFMQRNARFAFAGAGFVSNLFLGAGVTILALGVVALIRYLNLLSATRSAILGPR